MMERLIRYKNKCAIVTGASSGIGEQVAKDLVKAGLMVVALGLKESMLKDMQKGIPDNLKEQYHAKQCDVRNEEEVKNVFEWADKTLGGIHILVNNAGILRITELIRPGNTQAIRDQIDTNIMGVIFCTREAVNCMKNNKIDGHVVCMNSIAGHRVPNFGKMLPSYNIYPSTKYAITAMVETYRQEFLNAGTKIRITSVSPGAVATNIYPDEIVETVSKEFEMLQPEDVSDAILYALGVPPHVQIHELTIKPVGEGC